MFYQRRPTQTKDIVGIRFAFDNMAVRWVYSLMTWATLKKKSVKRNVDRLTQRDAETIIEEGVDSELTLGIINRSLFPFRSYSSGPFDHPF
jgi:hypothetical protein